MAQDRASDERRENVERSATESSASQASPAPLLLSLQQSAGNRAVVGLIQRLREGSGETRSAHGAPAPGERLIQRAPWKNFPAKFETKNDENAANSTYDVEEETYTRHAPINEDLLRGATGQVDLSGSRSFLYIDAVKVKNPDCIVAIRETATATVDAKDGNKVTLMHGRSKEQIAAGVGEAVIAHRVPREGLYVWDADVGNDGKVSDPDRDIHLGHPVVNLKVRPEDIEEYEREVAKAADAEGLKAEEERVKAAEEERLKAAEEERLNEPQENLDDWTVEDLLAGLLADPTLGGGELEPAFETEVGDEGQDTGPF